jgi:hypothetical protein
MSTKKCDAVDAIYEKREKEQEKKKPNSRTPALYFEQM